MAEIAGITRFECDSCCCDFGAIPITAPYIETLKGLVPQDTPLSELFLAHFNARNKPPENLHSSGKVYSEDKLLGSIDIRYARQVYFTPTTSPTRG